MWWPLPVWDSFRLQQSAWEVGYKRESGIKRSLLFGMGGNGVFDLDARAVLVEDTWKSAEKLLDELTERKCA